MTLGKVKLELEDHGIEVMEDGEGYYCPFCEEPIYFEDYTAWCKEHPNICPVCEEALW